MAAFLPPNDECAAGCGCLPCVAAPPAPAVGGAAGSRSMCGCLSSTFFFWFRAPPIFSPAGAPRHGHLAFNAVTERRGDRSCGGRRRVHDGEASQGPYQLPEFKARFLGAQHQQVRGVDRLCQNVVVYPEDVDQPDTDYTLSENIVGAVSQLRSTRGVRRRSPRTRRATHLPERAGQLRLRPRPPGPVARSGPAAASAPPPAPARAPLRPHRPLPPRRWFLWQAMIGRRRRRPDTGADTAADGAAAEGAAAAGGAAAATARRRTARRGGRRRRRSRRWRSVWRRSASGRGAAETITGVAQAPLHQVEAGGGPGLGAGPQARPPGTRQDEGGPRRNQGERRPPRSMSDADYQAAQSSKSNPRTAPGSCSTCATAPSTRRSSSRRRALRPAAHLPLSFSTTAARGWYHGFHRHLRPDIPRLGGQEGLVLLWRPQLRGDAGGDQEQGQGRREGLRDRQKNVDPQYGTVRGRDTSSTSTPPPLPSGDGRISLAQVVPEPRPAFVASMLAAPLRLGSGVRVQPPARAAAESSRASAPASSMSSMRGRHRLIRGCRL